MNQNLFFKKIRLNITKTQIQIAEEGACVCENEVSTSGDKLHNLCFSLPVFYALFRPLSQHDRGDDDNDEYGEKEEEHDDEHDDDADNDGDDTDDDNDNDDEAPHAE